MPRFRVRSSDWERLVEAADPGAAAEAALVEELFTAWQGGDDFFLGVTLQITPEDAPADDDPVLAWTELILGKVVVKAKRFKKLPSGFVDALLKLWAELHKTIGSDRDLVLLRRLMLGPPASAAERRPA